MPPIEKKAPNEIHINPEIIIFSLGFLVITTPQLIELESAKATLDICSVGIAHKPILTPPINGTKYTC